MILFLASYSVESSAVAIILSFILFGLEFSETESVLRESIPIIVESDFIEIVSFCCAYTIFAWVQKSTIKNTQVKNILVNFKIRYEYYFCKQD